jgi:hypothetical protein
MTWNSLRNPNVGQAEKECPMSNDPNAWLDPNTPQEAAIRHLVENTDVSPEQAKKLVEQHGTDHTKLMEIARTMNAEG